jgi:hypothetical protein
MLSLKFEVIPMLEFVLVRSDRGTREGDPATRKGEFLLGDLTGDGGW